MNEIRPHPAGGFPVSGGRRLTFRSMLLVLWVGLPIPAFSVGFNEDDEPTPTETTTECEDGKIWDDKTQGCVAPKESYFDDQTLFEAAREFAYVGQFQHAIGALNAMSNPLEDRVLAMLGFAYRGLGDMPKAFDYYALALQRNSDNLLARSYLGQAYVVQGNLDAAKAQLAQIRLRGGTGTWAEASLHKAITFGPGFRY